VPSFRAQRLLDVAAAGLVLLASVGAPAAAASQPAPQALLTRAWESLYTGDFVQVLALTSRTRTGRAMERKLQVVRKQSATPGKALVRFLEPAEIRGTSLLVLERDDRDDDLFVYLPAVGRSRRITSAQRSDAFFGTNLTYEDLEPKRASDFTASFADRRRDQGCVWLEIHPRPGVASQYDRILSCIEEARAVVFRTEYYVGGRLLKQLEGDPESVREFGGRQLVGRARLVTSSSGFETELVIESYDRSAAIPDELFTVVNLESGDDRRDRTRAEIGAPSAPR
jgi:hypothetical protein